MSDTIAASLWNDGYALVPGVLGKPDVASLLDAYADDAFYRSTINMARHSYGSGEYRYFKYPLPGAIQTLRATWYAGLAPIANEWNAATRVKERYPADLETYLTQCHEHGQLRPTPLILRYRAGDYNCMHQDVYGELGFPFQITIPLSVRDQDYQGGETILLEQAPRLQARPIVVRPQCGEALIFANRYRPHNGKRYNVRHGVGTVTRGERFALGIIFHDAQ